MANPLQKAKMMSQFSPIHEHEREGEDTDGNDEYCNDSPKSNGCGCFRLLGFDWKKKSGNQSKYYSLHHDDEGKCNYKKMTWWMSKFNKVKKLKVFITKIGGYCRTNKKRNKTLFQYDPHSYALNFDSANGTR